MKSSEIPEKEELEDTRYSLGFEKKEKNNSNINIIQIQPSIKDNRARSAKPFLLRKYIPKLKPVKSNLVPTTMHLEGETEISSLKKYKKKNKNDINVVTEEDYEKTANSGDERFSYNIYIPIMIRIFLLMMIMKLLLTILINSHYILNIMTRNYI